jgi:hypothetical protein
MTQYLLSVYGSAEELEAMPPEQMERIYKAVDQVNVEIKSVGAWVFAGGLHPATSATTVRAKDSEVLVTDGPYLETKEYLGGFWIIEVADLDAALEWARKATVACEAPIEVRPFQGDAG